MDKFCVVLKGYKGFCVFKYKEFSILEIFLKVIIIWYVYNDKIQQFIISFYFIQLVDCEWLKVNRNKI